MGFGHRVYKNFDPRATILRNVADDVLQQMGINDPLLEIAKQLEDVALKDDYFIEQKLYPNVDFTAACCIGPWAFRPTCSRSCLRWVAYPAGSLTGRKCETTPRCASTGHGRFTSVRRNVNLSRSSDDSARSGSTSASIV
jgi:hypothetical protein